MYGKHVETKDNYQKIFNAFVLPYNKYKNSLNLSNTIEYVGYAESSWKQQSSNKYYEHVAVILLDTKYLIDCFTKYENAEVLPESTFSTYTLSFIVVVIQLRRLNSYPN